MSFLAPTIDVLSRTKLRLWLAGIGVAVLGVGVWVFNTQVVGVHVTDCGFDAKGAYAKFRINNLLGGADARQQVWFDFSVDGSHPEKGSPGNYPYAAGVTIVAVPAHGRVTGVVHAKFPARGLHVEGRTVYVLGRKTGDVNDVRFVTEKVAQEHSLGKVSVETVPDDPRLPALLVRGRRILTGPGHGGSHPSAATRTRTTGRSRIGVQNVRTCR